jgi:iron complex outermembrane receptor protein
MGQRSENRGEEYLIPEYDLFDAGVFAFTQKSFERIHVSGGLRYDLRQVNIDPLYLDDEGSPADTSGSVKFREFSTTFSNISASIGASYQVHKRLTAKLNFSRGFRSPNLAELSSNGVHEGTFRYELGNTRLNPETSLQLDAGLLYNSDHVSLELSLFNNAIADYIYLQKLNSVSGGDSIVDPSDPAPAFQFVQGNANLIGGEFVFDLHPHPLDWLHFETSVAIVRGQQRDQPDSTKHLPLIPAPRIQTELRANFNKVGTLIRNLYISIDAAYTFAQSEIYQAFGTETATPAYTLINAGIGADVVNRSGRILFTCSVSAANLGNVAYQSHLSRLKYAPENPSTGRSGVFNMGRNVSIRLSFPLEFLRQQ